MKRFPWASYLSSSIYRQFIVAAVLISLLWVALVSKLMITDVWDETNGLLILAAEPMASAGIFESIRMIWLQELPLDIYRPFGTSLFIVFGKLTDGDFVILRSINGLFVVAAAFLFAWVLLTKYQAGLTRSLSFFIVLLFSASSLITAGWFANAFDASCLFFMALALYLYHRQKYVSCAVAIVLSIFCKETYVLALPFFALLIWDEEEPNKKAVLAILVSVLVFSALYWLVRQAIVPLGSESDVHGFSVANYFNSVLSFLAGFIFQFSKFEYSSPVFWIGLAGLAYILVTVKPLRYRLFLIGILLISSVIYWGMFAFQGDNTVSSNNFVARLYLIPFALFLFVLCLQANRAVLLLVAILSVWGMGATVNDHILFQQTYLQVYTLANATDQQLVVHFPEKPLEDFQRNLLIGNYPEAPAHINIRDGGLEMTVD